jgi:2-keto-3-deoxy-L-rhamnonate aldolase RhmA
MLFIGPADLAASIGRTGQVDDPRVADVIAEAESRIKRSGKWLGSIQLPGRDTNALFADGYDLVIASSDVTLLGEAAAAEVAACASE